MKNTVLFYKDEKSVKFWKTLPAEMSHKLLVACLEYNYVEGGGDLPEVLNDDPVAQALFLQLKEKIDYNEAKWAKDGRRKTSAENGRKHKKHEVVDEETGEIIEEHQEENNTNKESTGMTIKGQWVEVPADIQQMVCDNTERLMQMFGIMPTDSEETQEALQTEFESMSSIYNVEPSRNSKKLIKSILLELADRARQRQAEAQKQEEVVQTEVNEPVEEVPGINEDNVMSGVSLLREYPYNIPQQDFSTFYRSNPITCDKWMADGNLSYNELKTAFDLILLERANEKISNS